MDGRGSPVPSQMRDVPNVQQNRDYKFTPEAKKIRSRKHKKEKMNRQDEIEENKIFLKKDTGHMAKDSNPKTSE